MKKITTMSAVVLSLSLNVSANMGLSAGKQDFRFGNLKSNFINGQQSLRGVGISSNGTLSKYNYSLWVTNGHAGLDFNRSFKAKNGMSALVGVSAMDGLNNKSAYAEVGYGKWKLGVTALVIAAIVVKSSGKSDGVGAKAPDPEPTKPKPTPKPPTDDKPNPEPKPPTDDKPNPDPDTTTDNCEYIPLIGCYGANNEPTTKPKDATDDKPVEPFVSKRDNSIGGDVDRAIGKIKESDALKWTKGAWEWNKKQGEKNVAWVEKAALDTRDWVGHAAEDGSKWTEKAVDNAFVKPAKWVAKAGTDVDDWMQDFGDTAGSVPKWVGKAGSNTGKWVGKATTDAIDWVGGIFGVAGNQNYPMTPTQALDKLKSGTNVELSYMWSNKTILTVNGTGALNARHVISADSYFVVEGKSKDYVKVSYKLKF